MPVVIDMIGKRFGRLVVKGEAGQARVRRTRRYHCECDCGSWTITDGAALRSGVSKSCGCLRQEQSRKNAKSYPRHPNGRWVYGFEI